LTTLKLTPKTFASCSTTSATSCKHEIPTHPQHQALLPHADVVAPPSDSFGARTEANALEAAAQKQLEASPRAS
jgi:hypothetical protein